MGIEISPAYLITIGDIVLVEDRHYNVDQHGHNQHHGEHHKNVVDAKRICLGWHRHDGNARELTKI